MKTKQNHHKSKIMLQYYNTFIENLTIFLLSVGKTENEKEFDSRTTIGSDFKRRLTFFRFYLIKQTFFFTRNCGVRT